MGSGEQLYLTVGALQQSYTPESEVSQWGSTQVPLQQSCFYIFTATGENVKENQLMVRFALERAKEGRHPGGYLD